MNLRTHRIAESFVDQLVALDEPFSFKSFAYNQRFKMIAGSGQVPDLYLGPRNGASDQKLYIFSIHVPPF